MSLRLVLRATLLSTVVVSSGHPAENSLVNGVLIFIEQLPKQERRGKSFNE